MKTYAFPGTFNPFHEGHLWVIEQALYLGWATQDNPLYVVVGSNPNKNNNVSAEERTKYIQNRLISSHYRNIKVVSCEDSDLGEFYHKLGVDVLVRGLRNDEDFKYESVLTEHATQEWGLSVVYLPCPVELQNVSSTAYRGES